MGAGQLRERLEFQSPTAIDDGFGNAVEGFTPQFSAWARLQPRVGGETVMAARLGGRQIYLIHVHANAQTRTIAPDWQAVHADGRIFQIKSPWRNMDEQGAMLELDAETGVAA